MATDLLDQPSNRYGFTAGHVGIIGACLSLLLFFLWLQHDFRLPQFNGGSNDKTAALTYEQVREKVLAQYNGGDLDGAEIKNQLALVDGSLGGQVLGASSEVLPSADELFSAQTLNAIRVKSGGSANTNSVKLYFAQVSLVESTYNALGMVAAMNSSDSGLLFSVSDNATKLAANLAQIKVPAGLETYQRMKILYYSSLAKIAEIFATNSNNPQLSNHSVILFSISQKLEQEQNKFTSQYQIQP